ncbi:MAG: glucosaminidase domain-containing protein [Saprospiraceae bacterium]|nr:glucosaminidase domain-containing protein [Saprospiraceae bacterium]
MKIVFAFIFISLPSLFINDNKELASTYISNFKDVAVEEMHRTGIPASIKLAQGLLESDWGRSDLATSANNHFGIKCGGAWMGDTFYKEDDDKDEKGRLIESCFRSFSSPLESYMAHSDFLTDPKKEYRYGFLFDYPSTDYIAWAKGLKKSGYATDPNYPKKLIQIIEKYNLSKFDEMPAQNQFASRSTRTKSTKSINRKVKKKSVKSRKKSTPNRTKKSNRKTNSTPQRMPSIYVSRLKYDINSINNCRMVQAKGGETLQELSRAIGQSEDELLGINEIYDHTDIVLGTNEIIYLEKKKRSYRGDNEFHKVKEGETMESISQMYGIRLKSLYAKNRMPKDSYTFEGVKLSIRKTVSLDERPKFKSNNPSRRHKLLFEEDETLR